MKALYFEGDSGTTIIEKDIPEGDLLEKAKEKKMELISVLAEIDPKMEEYYLNEDINVPIDELKASIRKATIDRTFCPVFMGSAYKNKGV